MQKIRCPACRGTKTLVCLGGIVKTCAICGGNGYIIEQYQSNTLANMPVSEPYVDPAETGKLETQLHPAPVAPKTKGKAGRPKKIYVQQ